MKKFKIPGSIIERVQYIERISPFIGKNIIKVLTGQRRVGKSYLLFQIIHTITELQPEANIIYINKEDLEFQFIRNADDLNTYVKSKSLLDRMNYIFIDEIQEIEEFEKSLRSLLLQENIDIYCTGSNARLLSGELATMLSGRYIEFTIHSLSYKEFLTFHKLTDSDSSMEKYFKFGGLPYLIHLPLEDEIVFEYLKNIYSTIVFRDVIDRYNIRNIRFLEKLVQFLADNTGSLFSANRISEFLKSQQIKLAPNQIQVYIDYLVNAFLIQRVERYDIVGKRLFEIGEKYYFENMGIRHGIWGYRVQDQGKILENAVLNHLMCEGWKVYTGSIQAMEIDFVCEKKGEKMYLQVALQIKDDKTLQREFGNLLKIDDNYPKKVITMDTFTGNSYDGIEHINIRDFLTK